MTKLKHLQNFWDYKSIIFLLSVNELKLRYRSSVLGILWNFLEPLLILTILFFVFSNLLKTDIENYPLFLLLGIISFQMFSRTTSMGLDSIISKGGVVSSIKLPISIFPISISLTAFYMMLLEFVILTIFMISFQFIPSLTILFLPILLIMLFFLGLSLTIPLSVMNIHFRDLRSIWTIILQAAFFLSPVIYKLDFLPVQISTVLQYSPLAQLITMIRQVSLEGTLPDPFWFFYVLATILGTFLIGFLIYRHYRTYLVEKF